MRRRVIGRFEQEAEQFARLCWVRNNRPEARRVADQLRKLRVTLNADPNSSLT
jgi:hypothetical protein